MWGGRGAVARASAHRRIANGRLDQTCRKFGDELFPAVQRDSTTARWRRFFMALSVSTFIRLPFSEQITRVGAWLTATGDDLLERHRAELTRWSSAGTAALLATAATSQVRGEAAVQREALAEDLTRARDGLQAALVARANERGLPREWSGFFFRPSSRRRAPAALDGAED